MQIQIRWKDTGHRREYDSVTYRKMKIERYNGGWIIQGLNPENTNIHHCIICAQNAIDEQLQGNTRRNASERHKHGIRIIGTMED